MAACRRILIKFSIFMKLGERKERRRERRTKTSNRDIILDLSIFLFLPAFAECPVRKDGDECEKGTLRSSEGA